jgi:hypothetical protein
LRHAVRIDNKINAIENLLEVGTRGRWVNIIKMYLKEMNGRV